MPVTFDDGHVRQLLNEAIAAERERCAAVCDRLAKEFPFEHNNACEAFHHAAREIRGEHVY